MKNPCKTCHLLHKDKNSRTCMKCEKRIAYVRFMEGQPWGSESILKKESGMQTDVQIDIKAETVQQQPDDACAKISAAPALSTPQTIPGKTTVPANRICDVPGCGKKHLAKGLCYVHYHHARSKNKSLKNGGSPSGKSPVAGKTAAAEKSTLPSAMPGGGVEIFLDNDTWSRIKKLAEAELRSPENQVLYMLKSGCAAFDRFRKA